MASDARHSIPNAEGTPAVIDISAFQLLLTRLTGWLDR
jgi:hypothetical protein